MSVDFGEPLPEAERGAMIEKIAMDIHRRGLETPAILFLEMHKPLSFFASQTLIVTTPLIAPIVGFDRVRNAANLLESRDNVELLIRRIEQLSQTRAGRETTGGSAGASPSRGGTTDGSAGASPSRSGATDGSAGASPSRGGTTGGSAGASPSRGGATDGSAGASPSRGGATDGSAGASPSRGGATDGSAGASPSRGGATDGSAGASPSRGGATGDELITAPEGRSKRRTCECRDKESPT